LKGEGYFEVARDEGRPFVVTAGGVDLRVLGTAFNVNTHDPEGRVLATLVSGSLSVSATGDDDGLLLRPGQQAVASDEGIVAREVDVALYTSWVHGRFAFEGAALGQIARQLERWYDVRFRFEGEGLEGLLFTGMFKREYSIERAISIIARTTRVKFDKEGDTITVSR
jgi:ferric-dicitrate binding protein FerR (iron transport regulator)